MKIIIYFTDGVQARFENVHNISSDEELISFTYTNLTNSLFHNVSYCRDRIDRISLREVGI